MLYEELYFQTVLSVLSTPQGQIMQIWYHMYTSYFVYFMESFEYLFFLTMQQTHEYSWSLNDRSLVKQFLLYFELLVNL